MARRGGSNGRSRFGRLIDRLLGRDRGEHQTAGSTSLFTAHQPPPSDRTATDDAAPEVEAPEPQAPAPDVEAPEPQAPAPDPEAAEVQAPASDGGPAPTTPGTSPSEPDLFRDRPGRVRRDAWEEAPPPGPEPEQEPEPDGLHTSVHEEALDHATPRARPAPGVRVHGDHLDQRSGPVQLTPSQAIELARGGRETLQRRDRG